jgi:hypothetical protein
MNKYNKRTASFASSLHCWIRCERHGHLQLAWCTVLGEEKEGRDFTRTWGVHSDELRDGGARVEQVADEVDQLERSKGDQSPGEVAGCVKLGDSDSSTGGCSKQSAQHISKALRDTYGEEEGEVSAASAQVKAPQPVMAAYRKGDSGVPTWHWRSAWDCWGWWTWRWTRVKETAARTTSWHPRWWMPWSEASENGWHCRKRTGRR